MTWEVRMLHYGDQRVPGAQVFHQSGWDSWQTFSFFVFVLTDGDNVVLIDCGVDDPAPLNAVIAPDLGADACITHLPTGGMIAELLAEQGYALDDVTHVALTHLHVDHSGNLGLFPGAKVILGRRGWADHLLRRRSHPRLVGAPAFPHDVLAILDSAPAEGRLLLVDDGEEVLPGLRGLTIGGHTDDSSAYLVDTEDGTLLFPGDTIWTFDNLERDIAVGSHISVPDCLDAMAWARLQDATVMPSHDPALLERYPDGRVTGVAR